MSKGVIVLRRVCVLMVVVMPVRATIFADDTGNTMDAFRQGDDLLEQLARRRSIAVESVVLKDLVNDLEAESGICIVLDRRIDPSIRLAITTPLVRTDELLQLVVRELPGAGVSVGPELIYLGPRDCSEQFRTLMEQNRAAVRESRRDYFSETYSAMAARLELQWSDLTSPRDIVTKLANSVGLEWTNPKELRHDLWMAGSLPRLSFVEAATLLLIQFDMTLEIQPKSNTFSVVELPADVAIEKQHTIPRQMRDSARSVIEDRLPELVARWTRTRLRFRGTVEEHELVASLLKTQPADERQADDESLKTRLLTLSIPDGATYRQVIVQLKSSGVTIRDEANLGASLDATVSMELQRLPGEQFFDRLFRDLPVIVEVQGNEVILHARHDEE